MDNANIVPSRSPHVGIVLDGVDSMIKVAKIIHESGLAPKGYEKPAAILVGLQLGCELNLPPLAALQSICVINGRPGIYGDAALALVEASGLLEDYRDEYKGEGDEYGCYVTVKRKGKKSERTGKFTVGDAKRAKLFDKSGPWKEYRDRMLMFRARGFVLRDVFPDILRGIKTVEELQDYAEETRPQAPQESAPAMGSPGNTELAMRVLDEIDRANSLAELEGIAAKVGALRASKKLNDTDFRLIKEEGVTRRKELQDAAFPQPPAPEPVASTEALPEPPAEST